MKKIDSILKKCRRITRQLSRSSSKSSKEGFGQDTIGDQDEQCKEVFVGSSMKRYVIDAKHLNHPLLNALIERSSKQENKDADISVRCEVVIFDHLLWLLDNADPIITSESFDELAELYAC